MTSQPKTPKDLLKQDRKVEDNFKEQYFPDTVQQIPILTGRH